jgi:hypothetical protein
MQQASIPRLFFIVSRRQPELYAYLSRQFAAETDVAVLLDRRINSRRGGTVARLPGPESRQRDRRRNIDTTYQLLTMGYGFARPTDGLA